MSDKLKEEVEKLVSELELLQPDGKKIHGKMNLLCILIGWLGLPQEQRTEISSILERSKIMLREAYGEKIKRGA
jgi:hypothetical protein